MKLPGILSRTTRHERGSVLVICMVLAALGTLGIAAWFSLLDARSHQAEAGFEALERRVAARNSRALAFRAIYASVLPADAGVDSDTVYELPDGKGRATLRTNPAVVLRNDTAGPHSQNGVTPLHSASTSLGVDLWNGTAEIRRDFRLRNQHPALGGDLLTLHAPVAPADSAPLVSGTLRVKGRAVFYDAVVRDLNSGLRADEYLLPDDIAGTTTLSNVAGAAVLPLSIPHYRRTTGTTADGPAYRGEIELLSAALNPQNAYESRISVGVFQELTGDIPMSASLGPPTLPAAPEDATLLSFIQSNPPSLVVAELSQYDSLSSDILAAALHKDNPALTKNQILGIFDVQSGLPDDALTRLMTLLEESDLGTPFDTAMTELNRKNGARFNANGNGLVQIFLDRPEITQIVAKHITRLRLFGQSDSIAAAAAESLPPLLVVVDNRDGTTLEQIDFLHENRRPLILLIASSATAPVVASAVFQGQSPFPDWRGILELQNTGVAFDLSVVAGASLVGGIRGNHRLSVSGGTLTLELDHHGTVLAPLLSRDAWIETAPTGSLP